MNEPRESDIEQVIRQEELLVFRSFDEEDAWNLGSMLRREVEKFNGTVVIDIRRGDEILFYSAMPGTSEINVDYVRRKRNLVNLVHTSSYLVGLQISFQGREDEISKLDSQNYAFKGGCFPIRLADGKIVATVAVSGLPQREDHKLVTDVIADFLGVDLGEFSL